MRDRRAICRPRCVRLLIMAPHTRTHPQTRGMWCLLWCGVSTTATHGCALRPVMPSCLLGALCPFSSSCALIDCLVLSAAPFSSRERILPTR